LVASFAGREALDYFMESLRQLARRINDDKLARQYLKEIKEFILDSKTGECIQEEEYKRRSRALASRGRALVQQNRYEDELNDFLDCALDIMENIQKDEFVRMLRHHAGLVANDLTYVNSDGNTQIDTEMLGKLSAVIVPVVAESLKYIPIPRIEGSDHKRDYWVDNIVLCGYDIIPENVRFQVESDSEISIRTIETMKSYTKLIVTLKDIRTEVKNLEFYFKRKTFPEMTDQGRLTLRIAGDEGATLNIIYRVEQGTEDAPPKLGNGEVHFHIQKLDIKFKKGSLKHGVLVPLVTKLFKKRIQHQIEASVEENLGRLVTKIGDQLTEAMVKMNRPIVARVDKMRDLMKDSDVALVYEKRKEKLE